MKVSQEIYELFQKNKNASVEDIEKILNTPHKIKFKKNSDISMSETGWATTEELAGTAKHVFEEDKLGNARVEIFIDGDKKNVKYGITEIGHFHLPANVIIKIKKIKDKMMY